MNNEIMLVLDTNEGSKILTIGESHVDENGVLVLRAFIKENEREK